MFRKVFMIVVVLAALFALTTPAYAIIYGTPDGTAHPFVGSIVLSNPETGVSQFCTGTLIGEKVFLTVSHCAAYLQSVLAGSPDTQAMVTFDPVITASGTFYTIEQIVVNPNFRGKISNSDPSDVAVVLLGQAPQGIEPARLPTIGLLDQLKNDHRLAATRFSTVGYGDVRDTNRAAFQNIHDNLQRNQVGQTFLSLTDGWLSLSANLTAGNGGGCWGDSGGPHFIYLDGVETNIVVSLTAQGDVPCKAVDKTYRLDTEPVQSFLKQYVDLP